MTTRRTVLRGLLAGAAVSVALPPLESLTAHAAGGFPARFGVLSWGNGVIPDQWVPETTGPEWVPSAQLMPLSGLRDKLTVLSGFDVRLPNEVPHLSGLSGVLTGRNAVSVDGADSVGGPTIDQIAADQLGGDTRFRSLETGADIKRGVSFNAPFSRNPHETDPHALFERLFGVGFRAPGDDTPPDPELALRRSVLDAVTGHAQDLRRKVSTFDQRRIDQHLTSIRTLELQLARSLEDPPSLAACSRAEAPTQSFEDIVQRHRQIAPLLVMALACDQTRVFSHAFTDWENDWVWSDIGAPDGHHRLTHDEAGDQPIVHAITVCIMSELAWFLEQLDAVPEGDGTLLDHCAILMTSDVSLGQLHSLDEFPLIVAGSGCGALSTGSHLRSPRRESTSAVLLTVLRALGVLLPSFGTGDHEASDSLGDLEA